MLEKDAGRFSMDFAEVVVGKDGTYTFSDGSTGRRGLLTPEQQRKVDIVEAYLIWANGDERLVRAMGLLPPLEDTE